MEMCSTPFGVIEGFTPAKRPRLRPHAQCSTPFGVIEGFTGIRALRWPNVPSAQRRSASSKDSLGVEAVGNVKVLCSTPFGVIERFTRQSCHGYRHLEVLNAVRRHRRVHAATPRPTCRPWSRAQRRSASSKGSHWSLYDDNLNLVGAQRRSASSKGSRQERPHAAIQAYVLNAVRRHRRVHGNLYSPRSPIRMCSTPFGVIEAFTCQCRASMPCLWCAQRRSASSKGSHRGRCRARRLLCVVLNAVRRHRRVHFKLNYKIAGPRFVLNAVRRHRRVHSWPGRQW